MSNFLHVQSVFVTIMKKDISLKSFISDVLEQYPELEEVLMNSSPKFKKLRNPILRNTFARVTTIYQASLVSGIPAKHLLKKLRKAAGLDPSTEEFEQYPQTSQYLTDIPEWMEAVTKWTDLDVRPYLKKGIAPLDMILDEVNSLKPAEAIRIINDFLPVPVLDILSDRGCLVWAELEYGLFYSYVCVKI